MFLYQIFDVQARLFAGRIQENMKIYLLMLCARMISLFGLLRQETFYSRLAT